MTSNTQHIVQQFFNASSLDEVSVKQIENQCAQYPFFSVGHYLLSKKLLNEQADSFLEQTKKTALYFNNPFWLQWLLENSEVEKLPEEIGSEVEAENKMQALPKEGKVIVADEKVSEPAFTALQVEKTTDAPAKEELIFNSYHTVDYFASLGIKLILDDRSNDKFGKQLKSFTDWLKTMKRLPQKNEQDPTSADTAVQAAIEGFAAHSLQQKEIITEAMAEVLAKQGKNENAIMLYQKLSLLNPAKSAYFAAKIEQINEH